MEYSFGFHETIVQIGFSSSIAPSWLGFIVLDFCFILSALTTWGEPNIFPSVNNQI